MNKGIYLYSESYDGSCIEDAIDKINTSGDVELESWQTVGKGAEPTYQEILKSIDESDFICVDLTKFDFNILFELGYAIAKNKIIWITVNRADENTKQNLRKLSYLENLNLEKYVRSDELVNKFYTCQPHLEFTPIIKKINSSTSSAQDRDIGLFFIQSQFTTDYDADVVSISEECDVNIIIDDPKESKVNSLEWYLDYLKNTPATLIHFSELSNSDSINQNRKCSFLSGLTLGLGCTSKLMIKGLMEQGFKYSPLIHKFNTRDEASKITRPFIEKIKEEFLSAFKKAQALQKDIEAQTELQSINFGDFVAEHESEKLSNYYVDTYMHRHILNLDHKDGAQIIIGRKGSGKTATFITLQDILKEDVRNQICVIKPFSVETDGIIDILKKFEGNFQRGFFLGSVWKFLIYTEIAKSTYEYILKQNERSKTSEQNEFISYIEENENLFLPSFSTRLNVFIKKISDENIDKFPQEEFKTELAKILQDSLINVLKNHFENVFTKQRKLVVLIDNLDKSWRKNSDLKFLSYFILDLLKVAGRIAMDFRKLEMKKEISFHLVLFLRSDIFQYILKHEREPDKIDSIRLNWEDKEIFLKIVEERFVKLSKKERTPNELWEKFIAPQIKGINSKDFLLQKLLPRPRDILFFFIKAKETAVSRKHSIIKESDLITAHKKYSLWVFQSIMVENGITVQKLETFMFLLAGGKSILSKKEIIDAMVDALIETKGDKKVEDFIDHLVSLSFLGREVKDNIFKYQYKFDDVSILKALERRLGKYRYKVHDAFLPYLELT